MDKIIFLFLFLSLISASFFDTYYVPDEYWQSLEVAHKYIFGYGHLTWEWTQQIRSSLYPIIFAFLYKLLDLLGWDNSLTLALIPRIFQGFISALSDYSFLLWFRKMTGFPGYWAALTLVTSWFWRFCASRTIINTFETSLTIFGLNIYPWNKNDVSNSRYLYLAFLICAIRPTALIIWLPLILYQFTLVSCWKCYLFTKIILIGLQVGLVTTIIDSLFYGEFTLTFWNFFKANIFQNIGSFYGENPFYWYLIIGLPAVVGIHLIPFILGSYQILKICRKQFLITPDVLILFIIIWTIFIYSITPHKEFRFLLSILPFIHFISAKYLSKWSRTAKSKYLYLTAFLLLIAGFAPATYFGLIHQRGTVDAIWELSKEAYKNPQNTSFLFLMPCHSSPLYSHLHVNVPARFLSCEPDLFNHIDYIDEADQFYQSPQNWLTNEFTKDEDNPSPSHIICFDILQPHIQSYLSNNAYKLTHKLFHSSFHGGRIGENVLIFKKYL